MENYFQVVQIKKTKKSKVPLKLFWSQEGKFEIIENFTIHNSIALRLQNVILGNNFTQEENIPNKKEIINLYIMGPSGSGKFTLARFYTYLYTDIEDPCLNLETIKYESKELEYFKGSKHCELIIFKYNFNDPNLIQLFFETVCHNSSDYNGFTKKVIILKNIENLRKENLYLIKFYLEKYSVANAFILISKKGMPIDFSGFMCVIRVPAPSSEELIELGKSILKEKKIKSKVNDIKKVVKQSKRNIQIFKNLLELSYMTDKFNQVEETDNCKFLFLYKLMKKKTLKNVYMIRELLVDLLTENITCQDILKFLLNRFINSSNVTHEQKEKIIDVIVKTDLQDIKSLRNVIHLEYCCLQIINIME